MKTLLLLAASGLALTTSACAVKAPPARTALDCPQEQGDLTRTAVATDGKSCIYTTSSGAEVTLQLVSAPGGADAALTSIETTLLANRTTPPSDDTGKAASPASPATASADAAAATDASKAATAAAEQAREDSSHASVSVRIDSSGKHVTESGDGTTRVDLPGIHITANENDDSAKVRVGPISIDANDNSATIRSRRDVRLRGEAFSREKRGVRATFIYTGKDLPTGYRFVGYEAGGPKAGPITVAIVKSKLDSDTGEEMYPDVKKLVRKNGGV